jgi:hypothetical protein
VAAATSVKAEGTLLRDMLPSQAMHNTLAEVLTHLWHTERLWRHALQQVTTYDPSVQKLVHF